MSISETRAKQQHNAGVKSTLDVMVARFRRGEVFFKFYNNNIS